MQPLLKGLFTHVSHYDAVLPYNLNWSRNQWGPLASFLSANPIRFVDVGARGGPPEEIATLKAYLHYIGFDADTEECRRINEHPPAGYASFKVHPCFIAGQAGKQSFHLYRSRGFSSVYSPDGRFKRLWEGPDFAIEKTIEVDGMTLDDFATAHAEEFPPDFLKLDTQGSELDVLRGASKTLARTLMVESEVEFVPFYEGQPLFHDVLKFMTEHGFELLYLNRVFSPRRQVYRGPSRGQIIFGDALFGRNETSLHSFTPAQIAKYIVLLVQYGHMDTAFQLSREFRQAYALIPEVDRYFGDPSGGGVLQKIKRAALMQFDKLLALGLHCRRYNQRATDSDRSWPIR